MKVKVIHQPQFYHAALFGLGLSFGRTSDRDIDDITPEEFDKLKETALKLAHKQGGHNKFLESITLALDITAPRYWWSQADTYRVGVTKQSESIMHSAFRRKLTLDDFEHPEIPEDKKDLYEDWFLDEILGNLDEFRLMYENVEEERKEEAFVFFRTILPESFLQRRIVVTNVKVLQNMYYQRHNHRLKEWYVFFEALESGIYSDFVRRCIFDISFDEAQ